MALRRAWPCQAPGARLLLGCVALLCLAVAVPAVDELQSGIIVNQNCSTVDSAVTAALQGLTDEASVWHLGSGCSRLEENFVCSPINRSIAIEGAPDGCSVWDTEFDLYQFSAEPGVTVTIRNLTLARALVFTVGYGNMQPSLLHMRPGSRLVLQNVVVRTLCSTVRFYYAALDESVREALEPLANSSTPQPQPQAFVVPSLAVGGLVMENVTFTCDAGTSLPTNSDLVVHGAAMLTAFVAATSSLTLPSTIHLAENITLPGIAAPYNSDAPDAHVGVITADTTIESMDDATGGAPSSHLLFIDANHTTAWMFVQPPARLTLRRLVLTRLRTNIWSPGVMDGVLAGATPLFMVQAPGAGAGATPQQAPGRLFVDVVLVVPAYEVAQVSYWCVMVGIMVPELTWAADFLRSLVWQSDCDVLGRDAVFFRRVRTTATSYTRVRLTSVAPPGVPSDPADAPPPPGASAYPHVTPPLHFASTVAELAEAMAPLQPQDYVASPPPGRSSGRSSSGSSNASSITTTGHTAQLPVVVLVNGSLSLTAAALRAPGGGPRVIRRSVLITPMRRGCSGSAATPTPTGDPPPCTSAIIDLGNVMDGLRLEGPNTTVVFEGVTLRNASNALSVTWAFPGRDAAVRGLFIFNRTDVPRIIFDDVTVELTAAAFSDLYHALAGAPRGAIPGGLELYYMNSTLVQLASFSVAGGRGSWVNVTILPEELAKLANGGAGVSGGTGGGSTYGNVSVTGGDVPTPAPTGGGRAGGSGSDATTAVIVGAVLGGVMAMLVAAVGVFLVRRHMAQHGEEDGKPTGGKATAKVRAASDAAAAGAGAGLPASHAAGGLDSSGSSGTGRGTTAAAPVSGASGDVELGCMSSAATAASAAGTGAAGSAACSPSKQQLTRSQLYRAHGTSSTAEEADCGVTSTTSIPRTAYTSTVNSAEAVPGLPPPTVAQLGLGTGASHPGGSFGGSERSTGLERSGEDTSTHPPSSIPEVGEGGELEGDDDDGARAAAAEVRRSSGAAAGPRTSSRASSVPSGSTPGMLRSMSAARGRFAARSTAAAAAASAGGRTSNACDEGSSELPTTTRSLASDHSGFVSLEAGSSVMTDTLQSGVGGVVPGLLDPPTHEGPATTGSIGGGGRAGMAPLRTRRRGGGGGGSGGIGVPSTPGSGGVRVGSRQLVAGLGGSSAGGSGDASVGVMVGGATPRSSSSGLGSGSRPSAAEQLPAAPKSTGAICSPGMAVKTGKRASDTSGGGGSATGLLPVPQPALLMSPADSGMLGPGSSGGSGRHHAGGAASAGAGRVARSAYRVQNTQTRHTHQPLGGNNRRESSHPALLMGGAATVTAPGAGARAASGGACGGGNGELCDPMMSSTQLTTQTFGGGGGGGGGLHSSSPFIDVDGSSPGYSAPMGNVGPMSAATAAAMALSAGGTGAGMGMSSAEPASEVARLISELAGHTAEQLVILEPIGQGGYGTVYKGLWRNLDVAVKTVLFQDRQANVTTPAGTPGLGSQSTLLCSHTQPHVVTTGTAPTTVIEEEDLEDAELGPEDHEHHHREHHHEHHQQGHEHGYGAGGSRRASAELQRPPSRAASTGTPTHASLAHFAAGGHCDRNSASVPLHRVTGAGAPPSSRAASSQSVHCGFLSPSTGGTAFGGIGGGSAHGGSAHGGSAHGGSGTLPVINVSISHMHHPGTQHRGAPHNTPVAGAAAAPPPLGAGVASQQRAVLEAAVSCSVTHPNVVATYHYDITPIRSAAVVCSGGLQVADAQAASRAAMAAGGGVTDWKLYLVQEFCDAGSLASALDRRLFHDATTMPNLALTLCVLADIARGMAHIHTRSIVHGDLNPTNILLRSMGAAAGGAGGGAAGGAGGGSGAGQLPRAPTSGSALGNGPGGCNSGCATPGGSNAGAAGGGPPGANQLRADLGVGLVAKVADFGLCGMLAPGKRHISNALRGTPFYTSPETVATGTLTKASDVYSFGVIAWEVYTGRPPFTHSPERGFVRDDVFPRLPPHVPPTFANLTLACLSADPDQRPTFDQILDRIVQLQSKLAQSLQQRLSRLVASHGAQPGLGPSALVAAASASGGPGSFGASGAGGSGLMAPAGAMSPGGGSAITPGSAAGLLAGGGPVGMGGSGQYTPLFGPSIYTGANGGVVGGGAWMTTTSGFGGGGGGGLMGGTGGAGGAGAMFSTNSYGYAQAGGAYGGNDGGRNGGSNNSIGTIGAGGFVGAGGGFGLPLNAATALPLHVSPPMPGSHVAGASMGAGGTGTSGLGGGSGGGNLGMGLAGFPTYSANAGMLGVPTVFPHVHQHQQQYQKHPHQQAASAGNAMFGAAGGSGVLGGMSAVQAAPLSGSAAASPALAATGGAGVKGHNGGPQAGTAAGRP